MALETLLRQIRVARCVALTVRTSPRWSIVCYKCNFDRDDVYGGAVLDVREAISRKLWRREKYAY